MSTRFAVSLLIAAGLGLWRALLVATDGAVARVPLARARELASGSASGRALLALKGDRDARLSAASFASELLLMAAALVAALAPNEQAWAHPLWSALTGLGAAVLAVAFELALRSLGQAKPERWALAWSPLLRVVLGLFSPLWRLAVRLGGRLMRPLGGVAPTRVEPMPSLDELEAHLSAEAAHGRIGKADPQLLRSLIDFSEKTAREVMIPRTQVVGLELGAPVAEVVRVISEEGHTRVPVYRETLDDLIGILHSRDLVPLLANPALIRMQDLIRPVFYVPWSKRIGAVLHEMQRRHSHIAAVVDEYGGIMGVITLEDILAEIVGEFGSETGDPEEGPAVERLPDGSALVRGSLSREAFNENFGVELPGDDAETLAGWLNQRAGAIPELGDRFLIDGFVLQVVERSPSHVQRIRVSLRKAKAPGAPGGPDEGRLIKAG